MGSFGDGCEKTYEQLIPNFDPIKKFEIDDKNAVVGFSCLLWII